MCGMQTEVGMVLGLTGDRKAVRRFVVLALLATSLSGCSAVPGWVDPSNWFGPDLPSAQGDNGQTSNLANIPARPNAGSSPQERRAIAHSLVAARQQVQYSAQQLRGDSLPAAPPPGGSQPAPPVPANSAVAPASDVAQTVTTSQMPAVKPSATTPAGATAVPTTGSSQSEQTSSAAALPGVPAAAGAGFAPSKAPPLAPSVANYVPPQIMSRYASNAAIGSAPGAPHQVSPKIAPLGPTAVGPTVPSPLSTPTQVQFIHNGTALTVGSRKSVIAFAKAFVAQGGTGYVQVLGYGGSSHASVGALEANFARAQLRARKVADLLIKSGVPAAKILIQAHGQTPEGQTALAEIALK
jgi:outer membrane protein OmpA-like peptidoglycan-associated protein